MTYEDDGKMGRAGMQWWLEIIIRTGSRRCVGGKILQTPNNRCNWFSTGKPAFVNQQRNTANHQSVGVELQLTELMYVWGMLDSLWWF